MLIIAKFARIKSLHVKKMKPSAYKLWRHKYFILSWFDHFFRFSFTWCLGWYNSKGWSVDNKSMVLALFSSCFCSTPCYKIGCNIRILNFSSCCNCCLIYYKKNCFISFFFFFHFSVRLSCIKSDINQRFNYVTLSTKMSTTRNFDRKYFQCSIIFYFIFHAYSKNIKVWWK